MSLLAAISLTTCLTGCGGNNTITGKWWVYMSSQDGTKWKMEDDGVIVDFQDDGVFVYRELEERGVQTEGNWTLDGNSININMGDRTMEWTIERQNDGEMVIQTGDHYYGKLKRFDDESEIIEELEKTFHRNY